MLLKYYWEICIRYTAGEELELGYHWGRHSLGSQSKKECRTIKMWVVKF